MRNLEDWRDRQARLREAREDRMAAIKEAANSARAAAALVLIREAQSKRDPSTTGAHRVIKACKALRIEGTARTGVLHELQFCNSAGVPYSPKVRKVW